MSHLARTRPLLLALLSLALLAALPATAQAATGGASPGGASAGPVAPTAKPKHTGGAAPGTVARRRKRPRVRRVRRVRRPAAPVAAPATPGTPAAPAAPAAPAGAATLLADGTAAAPAGAPAAVAAVIAAGNVIASLPYRWGGGHARWDDVGYDCSGSVSYALHGGGLLNASAISGDLMTYGEAGPGTWITIYANRDHVFMVVAGLRFDTSGARPSRWQAAMRPGDGYAIRHPAGL